MVAVLAVMDMVCAVLMVSLMKAITADFGLNTPEQRWAFIRRVMYAGVAIALFAKGVYRLQHLAEDIDPLELWTQVVIVGYIVVFPLLRAVGVISQDKLNGQ